MWDASRAGPLNDLSRLLCFLLLSLRFISAKSAPHRRLILCRFPDRMRRARNRSGVNIAIIAILNHPTAQRPSLINRTRIEVGEGEDRSQDKDDATRQQPEQNLSRTLHLWLRIGQKITHTRAASSNSQKQN